MKILVILGHPEKNSFNYAIADTVLKKLSRNNHEVIFHDLVEEGFDPLIQEGEIFRNFKLSKTIEQHCDDLKSCDGIIIIHPNWWGQPPAVVKGWIDRVFRPGVAYEFLAGDNGEGVPIGLLKAKTAIVFNTSNTAEERENSIFKDPLETIWKNCIFDLCGVKNFHRKMFRIVITSSNEQREAWLREVENVVDSSF
jgi:putative NADPH-quinone reductase